MVLGHLVLAGFQEGTLFFKATYIGPTWLISVPIKSPFKTPSSFGHFLAALPPCEVQGRKNFPSTLLSSLADLKIKLT